MAKANAPPSALDSLRGIVEAALFKVLFLSFDYGVDPE
jgi:hypothetical protein